MGGTAAALDEEDDDEYEITQDELVRARSCELLLEVLRIVPARIDILNRVLGEHFPNKTVEKRVQANYIAVVCTCQLPPGRTLRCCHPVGIGAFNSNRCPD